MADPAREATEPGTSRLRPLVRVLLWDYERGSPAYDLALLLVALLLWLVPGGFWGDPLWPR